MKYLPLFAMFGIFIPFFTFAIDFTVAPLYFVDETADQAIADNNFHKRLLRELNTMAFDARLRFMSTGSTLFNPPQSINDAIILCRAENADFLIYGYISRKNRTIQGELRLLDYEKREVIESFFSMDSNEREDELIKDLAGKIFRFAQETYNIEIIPEAPSFTHIQFPLSMGYWMPVNKSWINLIYGIVRLDGGIQVIPNDYVFAISGQVYYISVGLELSYKLGIGHYYKAWNHGFIVSNPILFHRKINAQHEIFAGFGLLYSFELLYVKKMYEDPAVESYGAAGVLLSAGWTFNFKENFYFFVNTRLEFTFYDSPMLSIAPRAGIVFRKYTQEVVDKW